MIFLTVQIVDQYLLNEINMSISSLTPPQLGAARVGFENRRPLWGEGGGGGGG